MASTSDDLLAASEPDAAATGAGGVRPDMATATEMKHIGDTMNARDRKYLDEREEANRKMSRLEASMARMEQMIAEQASRDPEGREVGPPPPEFYRTPSASLVILGGRPSGAGGGPERDSRTVRVPAGSYSRATLLTGVYAPTDGSTLPVFLRLNEVVVGANATRIPIQQALLVGRARGDANSERAIIEITTVSYVDHEGRAHEASVSGVVVDDDPESRTRGYLGIPGEYVYRWDRLWPAMVASGVAGAADVFGRAQQRVRVGVLGNQTVDFKGDEFKAAGFAAVGGAADEFAEIFRQRASEMTPAVAVPSGVGASVAFDTGFDIPISPELMDHWKGGDYDEVDSSVYSAGS